jgi:mono/diheme cytochrome c family protein
MPSRAVTLLAVLCSCLGLTVGLAACGGDDKQSGTIALTDLPGNPENGSSAGRPSGAAGGTQSSGGDEQAPEEGGDAASGSGGGGSDAGGSDAGGGSANAEGKAIFTQSCAGCHTLTDAGASGSVGPNLDDVRPDEATVAAKVRAGGGGMPSFGGTLQPEQIQAVAAYVSSAAGS